MEDVRLIICRAIFEAEDALGALRRGYGIDVTNLCYPAMNSVREASRLIRAESLNTGLGEVATAVMEFPDNIQHHGKLLEGGQSVANAIERLCEQARNMGQDIRVAVANARVEQGSALTFSLVYDYQFLSQGAMPSLPGSCTVYGPFPSVDSTTGS